MVVAVVLSWQMIYPESQSCFAAKVASTGGAVAVVGLKVLL